LSQVAKVAEAAQLTATASRTEIREREPYLVVQRPSEAERVAEAQGGAVVRRIRRKHNGKGTLVP
jgi:hypothetical protein